jgi:hypothetical protein
MFVSGIYSESVCMAREGCCGALGEKDAVGPWERRMLWGPGREGCCGALGEKDAVGPWERRMLWGPGREGCYGALGEKDAVGPWEKRMLWGTGSVLSLSACTTIAMLHMRRLSLSVYLRQHVHLS